MFKINRKLEYALIALKHMNQKKPGELTSAKEICEVYKSPFDATARVLQIMTHNGLLKSEQGARGGYAVQKDLSEISFLDLVEMIEGSMQFANCLCEEESFDKTNCDLVPTCNIIPQINWLNGQMVEFYKDISLKDLLDTPGGDVAPSDESQEQFMV